MEEAVFQEMALAAAAATTMHPAAAVTSCKRGKREENGVEDLAFIREDPVNHHDDNGGCI